MTTDVAVPVSELGVDRAGTPRVDEGRGCAAASSSRRDGNFTSRSSSTRATRRRSLRQEALIGRVVEDALARGRTCTGEHGIGCRKLGYLEQEHGDRSLLRGIKRLFGQTGSSTRQGRPSAKRLRVSSSTSSRSE
jgi:D-lactate dehydrogenase (cytochrome)